MYKNEIQSEAEIDLIVEREADNDEAWEVSIKVDRTTSKLPKLTACPTCGSDKIKKVRRNWTSKAQGRAYTVPNLEYYECPDCDEEVYDPVAMRKIQAYSPAYSKRQLRIERPKAA